MTEDEKIYTFTGTGLNRTEKKWAKKRFEDYKTHYHIDTFSDLQILEELVFRESLHERHKKQIGKIAEGEATKIKNTVPTHLLEALDENLERIITLKEKLGLFADKNVEDPYEHLQRLFKKFKIWRDENQGSRTLICPHCSKMIMLKIRTEAWEALKHPFFKDRLIANEHLWELWKDGKITKTDIAKILGVSEDYVTWLHEKIYMKKPPSAGLNKIWIIFIDNFSELSRFNSTSMFKI